MEIDEAQFLLSREIMIYSYRVVKINAYKYY